MIGPVWLRAAAKGVWSRLTIRYFFLVYLCLWAMGLQLRYRVSGSHLVSFLPWIGIVLATLNLVLLLNHLLISMPSEHPLRQLTRRVEWWANLCIGLFVCYSIFLVDNAVMNSSAAVARKAEIVSISGDSVNLGFDIPYSWAHLRASDGSGREETYLLTWREKEDLWGGEAVRVQIRDGFFGIPWLARIEKDEEKYADDVLKLNPAASRPWRKKIYGYLEQGQSAEAAASVRDYLKIYPGDIGFARTVANNFKITAHYPEAIELFDYIVARRPNYDDYQSLGWTLTERGEADRAAKVLEASIPLRPRDWEAYYNLGYLYQTVGKNEQAVAMYKKVLEILPHFPEVEGNIASLQKLMVAKQISRP
jgi:tetratricopeptide (TPR) repeat protein